VTNSQPEADRLRPVADLLADYLAHTPGGCLPGVDGVRVEDVLGCYEYLAAHGQVPAEAELCRQHPEWASRLVAFFHLQHATDDH
jgi:hypothetical protein